MSFLPYSKLRAMVAIATVANDCMWCNYNNPTIKQSQTTAVQGEKNASNYQLLTSTILKWMKITN
jgi:hypothetical protein